MSDPLRLFFLGTPRFERDAEPVEISSAKAIALLGYLAVRDDRVLREQVLDLLWPSSTPDAARKNLRNTLWSLRKAFGEDSILTDDQSLRLNPSLWTDVRELQVAHSLAATDPDREEYYGGPFLDGLGLNDAPDYEIWLTTQREQLAQIELRVLARRVQTMAARGEWQAVIETASRALSYDNLQEPMYQALMQAHARLGQRDQALKAYEALRVVMERELGVEPLPESTALRSAILDGSYQVSAAPLLSRKHLVLSPVAPIDQAPFVGREDDRIALDDAYGVAAQGKARVLVLGGELGIGKTRLWQEWSRSLQGVTLLETRCLESMQSLPMAPLVELLRQDDVRRKLLADRPLAPVWMAQVARLLPEIGKPSPTDSAASSGLPAEEERLRLFEALVQALSTLAPPLVLFVDDVQWADRSTLDWLDYAVHRMAGQPLLVVLALRPEDTPEPLALLIARWMREGIASRHGLDRLSVQDAERLAAALKVDEAAARRIVEQSAGNPYFILELVRALPSEDVPPVLAELLRARLDRLPESPRQVLQAAAVLEAGYDLTTLRQTSGRDEEETVDALDVLLHSGLLQEQEGGYAFAHPLVGGVVRAGLSHTRHAFLHRRAARAMERAFAERLGPVAGRIAAHYAEGNELRLAAHFADMAADYALSLAAPAEAASFGRQALTWDPTAARLLALGRALFRQGDLVQARGVFEQSMTGYLKEGDRQAAARAALAVAETFYPAGLFEEGNRWVERAIEYVADQQGQELHALAHLLRGISDAERGNLEQAERQLVLARQHLPEHSLYGIGGRIHFMLGNVLAERGELGRALEAYGEARAMAERAGDDFQQALALNNLAYHSLLAGDRAAAHRYVEQGLALAETRALRTPLQHLYSTSGEIALAERDWDRADEWFRRAIAEAERNRNAREVANNRANLGLVAQGRGDLDSALGLLESSRQSAAGLTDRHLMVKIELMLAELYLRRGECAAARGALGRAQEQLRGTPRRLLEEWAARLRDQLSEMVAN